MNKFNLSFLDGFISIGNMFEPVERLPLSKGGFAGDQIRLGNDANKIKKDFSKVVNGRQKNPNKR